MVTLDELAAEEDRLSRIMGGASGWIEEQDRFRIEHGIYDAYAVVYQGYARLALQGNVEAVSASIFRATGRSHPSATAVNRGTDDRDKVMSNLARIAIALLRTMKSIHTRHSMKRVTSSPLPIGNVIDSTTLR